IYAVDEEVELFINDVSVGQKPAGPACQNRVTFDVTYQPGTIEAVGYCGGKEASRTFLKTAGAPVALRLAPDRDAIRCDYGDLAYITIEIVDQHGYVVKYTELEVFFEVMGAGELLAVGTANPMSEEPYVGNRRKAWNGRLLAVVRSSGQPGEMVLRAHADGLLSSELRLQARED
ncbi:MAG TPA: DUF4982 domain-containing protein, partial [Ktedonobacteraceae bacterium]|nr:DUF4982 domain-containing protein [Ktedonobacteraceae bacterium]